MHKATKFLSNLFRLGSAYLMVSAIEGAVTMKERFCAKPKPSSRSLELWREILNQARRYPEATRELLRVTINPVGLVSAVWAPDGDSAPARCFMLMEDLSKDGEAKPPTLTPNGDDYVMIQPLPQWALSELHTEFSIGVRGGCYVLWEHGE